MLKPFRLRVAALDEASGLNGEMPTFSWALDGDAKAQCAFRVVAGTDPDSVTQGKGDLWDSGKREEAWPGVTWDGPPPVSDLAIWWSVQVWDENGQASGFAAPVRFFRAQSRRLARGLDCPLYRAAGWPRCAAGKSL
nr:hypothetical protein [Marinicella sp. W31]MDC2877922.1 hypothetical protein [Marinicella sp. W31]